MGDESASDARRRKLEEWRSKNGGRSKGSSMQHGKARLESGTRWRREMHKVKKVGDRQQEKDQARTRTGRKEPGGAKGVAKAKTRVESKVGHTGTRRVEPARTRRDASTVKPKQETRDVGVVKASASKDPELLGAGVYSKMLSDFDLACKWRLARYKLEASSEHSVEADKVLAQWKKVELLKHQVAERELEVFKLKLCRVISRQLSVLTKADSSCDLSGVSLGVEELGRGLVKTDSLLGLDSGLGSARSQGCMALSRGVLDRFNKHRVDA